MSRTHAQYRLVSSAGAELEAGQGDVSVSDKAFVLAPVAGEVLRVPFAQITSVGEDEPYTVRVTLADGTVVELSKLGVMRTQLLAELADRRGDSAAKRARAVGDAEVFTADSGGVPVELRVYDDVLMIIGAAAAERVGFSFVRSAENVNYEVRIDVAGLPVIALTRLGRRTDEFVRLLSERITGARSRTAAFLGSLLPGLSAMELRGAAGKLRDGVAAPAAELNAIHPDLVSTLIEFATLPQRREAVTELGRRTELAIGFKQVRSVHQEAVGVTPWRDHAAAPHIGEHESPGGFFAPGLAGMMAAGVMAGGPPLGGPGWGGGPAWGGGFGGAGLGGGGFGGAGFGGGMGGWGASPWGGFGGYDSGYWAFRALGAGMNQSGQQRPMASRPDVRRGQLTPATEDLDALVATGADPTVLAFVLGSTGGRVVFEVLNLPGPPTFVYRAAGPDGVAAINRALDDAGFQATEVHATGLGAPVRADGQPGGRAGLLSQALVGQAEHDADWPGKLAGLLGG